METNNYVLDNDDITSIINQDDINQWRTDLNPYITSDFSRKSRSILEMRRWKATEFRQYLLYTGQIVLKNNISDECYSNFMTLNIAMLILLSPNNNYLLDYAKKLLDYFVKSFQILYIT